MKVLITGVGGMVGSHMTEFYFDRGISVTGTFFKPTTNLEDIKGKADLLECDVRYFKRVLDIVKSTKPDKIFHLAAQSYPTVSWDRPDETMDINANGTIHIFESVKQIKAIDPTYDPIVVVACSSAEYGASLTPENTPIIEETTLLPLHPYGVSKVAQDLLSYQYFANDQIKCIRARIFNTTGPRKVNDVVSDFVKRAVEIQAGKAEKLRVGNVETKRAITDVRDLVKALVLLSENGKWGDVYNISGEKAYQIKEIIPILEEALGMKLKSEVDPALLRPTDETIIYGDSSKLKNDTNWEQRYDLRTTVRDMTAYLKQKQQ